MSAATVPAVSDISRSRLAVSASATRRKKISCARVRRADSAQDPAPSALPGSMGAIGRFSGPPDAPIGHPQREQPADLAAESARMALSTCRWPAVMAPRDAGLRADDPVASRAELQMAVELRSRAPGPVLPAPAGERWPFCARLGRDPRKPANVWRRVVLASPIEFWFGNFVSLSPLTN
jgi:hypothetical protein